MENTKLLDGKHKLHRAYIHDKCLAKKAALSNIRSTVQCKLREMQDTWLSQRIGKIRQHTDQNDVKRFYDAIKAMYGPQLACINKQTIKRLPQADINHGMDNPPNMPEVKKATDQSSSDKTPGADAIPAEVYKLATPQLHSKMTQLFQAMWTQGTRLQRRFHHTPLQNVACGSHSCLTEYLEQDLLPESQHDSCKRNANQI